MDSSKSTAANAATPATPAPTDVPGPQGQRDRKGTSDPETPTTLNQIRYPCLMNMEYHAAREAWLDSIHRWLMFIVIAGGASAFVDATSWFKVAGPLAALIAGSLDLTFDLSNRARTHAMHRRAYGDIMSKAVRDPDTLRDAQCEMEALSGEEEPPFAALLAGCSVRASQATYGEVVHPVTLSWYHRRFKNIVRFSDHDFNAA